MLVAVEFDSAGEGFLIFVWCLEMERFTNARLRFGLGWTGMGMGMRVGQYGCWRKGYVGRVRIWRR